MHIARKRFGQNFLIDSSIIQQIIHVINPSSTTINSPTQVVEIGPGHGALTHPLFKLCKNLIILEIDRDLAEKLQKQYQNEPGLTVLCTDALKFEFDTLAKDTKLKIIGNLPYNISTPLLFHLFKYNQYIEAMYFMLQKEVVDRMVAMPNSKAYGRLSVMTQYFCKADALFTVPPTAFFPVPKVQSAVVRLTPHHSFTPCEKFNHVVKMAFSQRRKTLANVLSEVISKEALIEININPLLRAENLSIEDYIKISNHLKKV